MYPWTTVSATAENWGFAVLNWVGVIGVHAMSGASDRTELLRLNGGGASGTSRGYNDSHPLAL